MKKYIVILFLLNNLLLFSQQVRKVFPTMGEGNQYTRQVPLDAKEKTRKDQLKKISVGDMICAKELYFIVNNKTYNDKFEETSINAFVEQKAGNKIQIRIVEVNYKYLNQGGSPEMYSQGAIILDYPAREYPFLIKNIKIEKGSIHWIDPITDPRFFNCE